MWDSPLELSEFQSKRAPPKSRGFFTRASVIACGQNLYFFGGSTPTADGDLHVSGELQVYCSKTQRLAFVDCANARPKARAYASLISRKGLFVLYGGRTGTGAILSDLHTAEVGPDGKVVWQRVRPRSPCPPTSFPAPELYGHAAVYHPERDTMIVIGGCAVHGPTAHCYEYSFSKRRWKRLNTFCRNSSSEGPALAFHKASLVGNTIFVYGGETSTSPFNTTCYTFELDTMLWTPILPTKALRQDSLKGAVFDFDERAGAFFAYTSTSVFALTHGQGERPSLQGAWSMVKTQHKGVKSAMEKMFSFSEEEYATPSFENHLVSASINGVMHTFCGEKRVPDGEDVKDGFPTTHTAGLVASGSRGPFLIVNQFDAADMKWQISYLTETPVWIVRSIVPTGDALPAMPESSSRRLTREPAPLTADRVLPPRAQSLPTLTLNSPVTASGTPKSVPSFLRQPTRPATVGQYGVSTAPTLSTSTVAVVLKSDSYSRFRESVRFLVRGKNDIPPKEVDVRQTALVNAEGFIPSNVMQQNNVCKFDLNSDHYPPGSEVDAKVFLETKDVHSIVNLDFTEFNRHLHLNIELHITLNEERHQQSEAQREYERQQERERDRQRESERQHELKCQAEREVERRIEEEEKRQRAIEREQEAERERLREAERMQDKVLREHVKALEAQLENWVQTDLDKERSREWEREEERAREILRQQERKKEDEREKQRTAEIERGKEKEIQYLQKVTTLAKEIDELKKAAVKKDKDHQKELLKWKQKLKTTEARFEQEKARLESEIIHVIQMFEQPLRIVVGDCQTQYVQMTVRPLMLFPSLIIDAKGSLQKATIKIVFSGGYRTGDELKLGHSGALRIVDNVVHYGEFELGAVEEEEVDEERQGEIDESSRVFIRLDPHLEDEIMKVRAQHSIIEAVQSILREVRFSTAVRDPVALGERKLRITVTGTMRKADGSLEELTQSVSHVFQVSPPIIVVPASLHVVQYRPAEIPQQSIFAGVEICMPIAEGIGVLESFQGGVLEITSCAARHHTDSFVLLDRPASHIPSRNKEIERAVEEATVFDLDDVCRVDMRGTVFHGETAIGKVTQGGLGSFGTMSDRLCIAFEETAVGRAVQMFLRSIAFQNTTPNCPKASRRFEALLRGGSGSGVSVISVTVAVIAEDEPTEVILPTTAHLYRFTCSEYPSVPGFTCEPQLLYLAADGLVQDPDTTEFTGGFFRIELEQSRQGDCLAVIPPPGSGLAVEGSQLLFEDNVAGMIEDRDVTSHIKIQFDCQGTPSIKATQEILRSIVFYCESTTLELGTRLVTLTLKAGKDVEAIVSKQTIRVAPPLCSVSVQDSIITPPDSGSVRFNWQITEEFTQEDYKKGFLGGFIFAEIASGLDEKDLLELARETKNGYIFVENEENRIDGTPPTFPMRSSFRHKQHESLSRSRGFNIYTMSEGKPTSDNIGRLYQWAGGLFVQFATRRQGNAAGRPVCSREVRELLALMRCVPARAREGIKDKLVRLVVDDGRQGYTMAFTLVRAVANDITQIIVQKSHMSYRQGTHAAKRGCCLFPDVVLRDPDSTNFHGGFVTVEVARGEDPSDTLYLLSVEQQRCRDIRVKRIEDTFIFISTYRIKTFANKFKTTRHMIEAYKKKEEKNQGKKEGEDNAQQLETEERYLQYISVDQDILYIDEEPIGRVKSTGHLLRIDFVGQNGTIPFPYVENVLRCVAFHNTESKSTSTSTRILNLTLNAGDTSTDSRLIVTLDVHPPLLYIPGFINTIQYMENSGSQYLFPKIQAIFPDNVPLLTKGFVCASIEEGEEEADVLAVDFKKKGEKFTFVAAGNKLYAQSELPANLIGVFSLTRHKFTLDFSADCKGTKAHIQQLLRSISFTNNSENPSETLRVVDLSYTDGGFDQALCQAEITVIAEDDSTEVKLLRTQLQFVAGSAPIPICPSATVTDPDTEWFNAPAFLSVQITGSVSPGDQMSLLESGGVSVREGEVFVGDARVGSVPPKEMGTSGFKIVLTSCSIVNLQTLVQNISYVNTSARERSLKKGIVLTIKDDKVNITRVNLQVEVIPALLDNSSSPRVEYKGSPVDLAPQVKVKSPTPSGFGGGSLVVEIKGDLYEPTEGDILQIKGRYGIQGKKEEVIYDNVKLASLTMENNSQLMKIQFVKGKIKEEGVLKLIKCISYMNTKKEKHMLEVLITIKDSFGNSSTLLVPIHSTE